jgi:hypothetical protein
LNLRPPGYERPDTRLRRRRPSPPARPAPSHRSTRTATSRHFQWVPVTHLAEAPPTAAATEAPCRGSCLPNQLAVEHRKGPARTPRMVRSAMCHEPRHPYDNSHAARRRAARQHHRGPARKRPTIRDARRLLGAAKIASAHAANVLERLGGRGRACRTKMNLRRSVGVPWTIFSVRELSGGAMNGFQQKSVCRSNGLVSGSLSCLRRNRRGAYPVRLQHRVGLSSE